MDPVLIGEVAKQSGVSARMLRHYESLGLVQPSQRTDSGYREYSAKDIQRIFHIESLRSLGLSLRDIGRALDDPDFTPAALVGDLIRQTHERITTETELLTRLRRIDAADPTDWQDVLTVVALLQALGSHNPATRQRAALSTAHGTPLPVEALVEAALSETQPNVAGTLRWALAQAPDDAPALLAKALDSPLPAVRRRAVQALAKMPEDETTPHLRDALTDPDPDVRAQAALALGTRAESTAIPTLIDMIVTGRNDTDAADTLSKLASDDTATADRITTHLVDHLTHPTTRPPARGRLTQALADIPGTTATQALDHLSHDEDPAVSLTATYLLQARH